MKAKKQATTKTRIRIEDLPEKFQVSKEDMQRVQGGVRAFQALSDPAQSGSGKEGAKVMKGIYIAGRF